MLWNTGFSLFRDTLQFGVMLVLVRIISPQAYGQFGLVTTLLGFLYVFSARSFVAHTLQHGRDEHVDYQIHFTAGGVIHGVLFVLTNAVAVALRWWPTYAPVSPLLHVMSLALPLDWLADVRIKMLERALDWRRMRLLHGAGLLANAGVAVAMAVAGAGVYALLVPALCVRLPFIVDIFAGARWRPTWEWSASRYAPAWWFGAARLLSAAVASGRQLLESGALVPLVGYARFGVFGRATGLAQMFLSKFALLLMQSIYPALTRLDGGPGVRARAGGLVLRSVAWVVIPIAVIMAVLADPVIRVVYGHRWLEVIPLVPWAMAAGGLGSIGHAAYMLLLANDRQQRCLAADVAMLAGTGAALVWLAPRGLSAYLGGLVATHAAVLALLLVWLRRDAAVEAGGIAVALLPPSFATACAWAVCEAGRSWGRVDVAGVWPALGYGAALCAGYVGVLRIAFSAPLAELVRYAPAGRQMGRLLMLGPGHGIHYAGKGPD